MRLALSAIIGIAIGVIAQILTSSDVPIDRAPPATERKQTLSAILPTAGNFSERAAAPIGERSHQQYTEPVGDDATFQDYLERHDYSKDALLGVFFLSKGDNYLVDAARRFPDDPNVQLLVISKHLLPGERREWIERFKGSQPDNILGSIFLGGDLIAEGDIEAGIEQMRLAASQTSYRDFIEESCLAAEAVLLDLGYSPVETKMRSGPLDVIKHLNPMNAELRRLRELAEQTEDLEQKTELARIGLSIGRQLDSGDAGELFLNHLVGRSNIDQFAKLLPPEEGAAIIDEMGEIQEQLSFYQELEQRSGELTEQQYLHLLDRSRSEGGFAAMRWMSEQIGVPWEGAEPRR